MVERWFQEKVGKKNPSFWRNPDAPSSTSEHTSSPTFQKIRLFQLNDLPLHASLSLNIFSPLCSSLLPYLPMPESLTCCPLFFMFALSLSKVCIFSIFFFHC
eukprot:TRINITY_DN6938_c1_g1_i6.p1 TRINITY_DN6938_c1_g1~~TRINITY_DN6938_c1_g1_i6.p1  ORF type:complete len:102 (-),score=12.31 TRINITY_DN6938_c1_g1_i6:454-759(-)